MRNKKTIFITQAALIAALYVVLTMAFSAFSFGQIQVRVSEALTILPFFTPAAIPGLFVGCLLGNILGGGIPVDIIFGSLATLLGAVGTYLLRGRKWLAPLPPILANTIIVPFVLRFGYGINLPIPLMFPRFRVRLNKNRLPIKTSARTSIFRRILLGLSSFSDISSKSGPLSRQALFRSRFFKLSSSCVYC